MILDIDYNEDRTVRVTNLIEYNKESIEKCKQLAEKFKENNILLNDFDENLWTLNEEYEKVSIRFDKFNQIVYKKEFKNRKNMYTFDEFINSIKGYHILLMKKWSIYSVKNSLSVLTRYINETNYFNEKKSTKVDINKFSSTDLRYIEGYLNFVEFNGVEHYRELLEEQSEYKTSVTKQQNKSNDNRRELADFQSIFLFDRIIKDFFENSDSEKRDEFFILYVWWNLTGIIPLRLKEFCITPYDCIEVVEDKYYIKLRRSIIKGSFRDNRISHKIDQDYELRTYPINKKMADLISKYKEITNEARDDKEQDILVCYKHYLKDIKPYLIEECDEFLNNTFRIKQLRRLLNRFFRDVVHNIYGYNLIEYSEFLEQRKKIKPLDIDDEKNEIEFKFEPLNSNEITMFRLGDIRHVALINLVLNDVNPILVKEFVNHKDINTTFHYFGNIGEVVKCISFIKYKNICQHREIFIKNEEDVITTEQIFNRMDSVKSVDIDNGRCISKKFIAGKLDDCMKVDDCDEGCNFFIRETALTEEEKEQKLKQLDFEIQKESDLIESLLKTYRNLSVVNEQLSASSLRLQRAADLYCEEKIKSGEIVF